MPRYANDGTLNTVEPGRWDRVIHVGAVAIANNHMEPNDGTPEEFAAWALQAMLPEIAELVVARLEEARLDAARFHERAALAQAVRLVTAVLLDERVTPRRGSADA